MKKIQISPSILSADFSQLAAEIKRLEEGGADMIHVDVMDGHFVPNLTIGPPVIKALRKHCKLMFDVHLMISPVHKYIKDYSDSGEYLVEPVAMPPTLQALVEKFSDDHFDEKPFIKRKRDKVKLDNTEVGKGDIRVEKIADVFSSPSILKSRKDN